MMLNDRQQHIADLLLLHGEVRIAALRDAFQVTEMTIRRDLEKLESAGLCKRTFGGAIALGKDIALQERSGMMTEEKARIGRLAAELVQAGESIFLDGGTTTLQVARFLQPESGVTVVTNAINIAMELIGKKISTLMTGGSLMETTASLVGPIAAETLSGMAFDRIFLGASGLHALHGFSNSNVYEAEIKKLAVRRTSEVNIVLDHTKFGVKELVSFAPLNLVSRVCTDRLPEGGLLEVCREAGLEIVTAD